MTLKMYSIRDAKAEIFNPPFFNKTDGEAIRNFQELANDEKSKVSKYPEDFDLWYLGQYDDNTGKMVPQEPKHMHNAATLKT